MGRGGSHVSNKELSEWVKEVEGQLAPADNGRPSLHGPPSIQSVEPEGISGGRTAGRRTVFRFRRLGIARLKLLVLARLLLTARRQWRRKPSRRHGQP